MLHDRLRMALGLRRAFSIEGVRYRERGSEPLHRAISRRGRGFKEYQVTFPGGASTRIRCTPNRHYADISGELDGPLYERVADRLRPGRRILDLHCGTGYGSAWIASMVGPSGAVVALNRDGESIRFARRRYKVDHVAFEIGTVQNLLGELDGAFDGAVAVHAMTTQDDQTAVMRELLRVVAPGGWVLVASAPPRSPFRAPLDDDAVRQAAEDLATVTWLDRNDARVALLEKI